MGVFSPGKAARVAVVATVALFLFTFGPAHRPQTVSADANIDVTADAAQTFYFRTVPHTTSSGQITQFYDSASSFLPRGIYFAEPCLTAKQFSWSSYAGGDPAWNGTYQLFVNVGSSSTVLYAPERVLIYSSQFSSTTAVANGLPAGANLYYTVYPNPWSHFILNTAPVGQGAFTITCPAADVDDPNAIGTLASNGFNLALIKEPHHPRPFIDLKAAAGSGAAGFKFVIDAREPYIDEFPDNLYEPTSSGGQGYGQSADIFGWQLEDEPVLLANNGSQSCDNTAMQAAVNRLSNKYSQHPHTSQVFYHVEGAPIYFQWSNQCDPGHFWDDSVRLGDVANHDYYLLDQGEPLTTVQPIAESMQRQTTDVAGPSVDVAQQNPSWFTAQAYSQDGIGCRAQNETRATVYTALIHGATGIWQFAWDSPVVHPGIRPIVPSVYPEGGPTASPLEISTCQSQWSAVSGLNTEMQALAPYLLSPTSTISYYRLATGNTSSLPWSLQGYRVFASRNGTNSVSPVRTILKEGTDGQYLFVVNMDNQSVDVKYQFPDYQVAGDTTGAYAPLRIKSTQTSILYGGSGSCISGLTCSDFSIADTLPAFGARVYRIVYTNTSNDKDNDGCPDAKELGANNLQGGRRDPFNPWDFFNPEKISTPNTQTVADIEKVVQQFGKNYGNPAYTPTTDRTAVLDGDVWDLGPPDGQQTVADIAAAVKQYAHNCSP